MSSWGALSSAGVFFLGVAAGAVLCAAAAAARWAWKTLASRRNRA